MVVAAPLLTSIWFQITLRQHFPFFFYKSHTFIFGFFVDVFWGRTTHSRSSLTPQMLFWVDFVSSRFHHRFIILSVDLTALWVAMARSKRKQAVGVFFILILILFSERGLRVFLLMSRHQDVMSDAKPITCQICYICTCVKMCVC